MNKIVDDISGLTPIQTTDLVSVLKVRICVTHAAESVFLLVPTQYQETVTLAATVAAPAVAVEPTEGYANLFVCPPVAEWPRRISRRNQEKEHEARIFRKSKVIKEVETAFPTRVRPTFVIRAKKFTESLPKSPRRTRQWRIPRQLKNVFECPGVIVTVE